MKRVLPLIFDLTIVKHIRNTVRISVGMILLLSMYNKLSSNTFQKSQNIWVDFFGVMVVFMESYLDKTISNLLKPAFVQFLVKN